MQDAVACTASAQDGRAPACLLLLCGLPAAGKTTLARALAQIAQQRRDEEPGRSASIDVRHICYDDYQQQDQWGNFDPALWKAGRQRALAEVAAALSAARNADATTAAAPPHGGNVDAQTNMACAAVGQQEATGARLLLVIADDNTHLRSMRHQARRLAGQHAAAFQVVHMRCPPDRAERRNAARPQAQRVPPHAMRRMCQGFEEPAGSATITVDSSSAGFAAAAAAKELLSAILQGWGPPQRPPSTAGMEEARQAGQAATAASVAHQLDIASRSALAAALQTAAGLRSEARAALAQELNTQRRSMLDDFRHCAKDQGAAAVAAHRQLAAFQAAADEAVIHAQLTGLHLG